METPRDLLRAVVGGRAAGVAAPVPAGRAAGLGQAESPPVETDTLVGVLDWHARHHPDRRRLPGRQLYNSP